MSAEDVYAAWAPDDGRWSPWVKPVLFAYVDDDGTWDHDVDVRTPKWLADALSLDALQLPDRGPHRTSAHAPDTALIIDLPAGASIAAGLELVAADFFPVPLFNALPHPDAVIDLERALELLVAGADLRSEAALPDDAPPAFLLDSRRYTADWPLAGQFDNRSVMFSTDFPSGDRLAAFGIRRVVVVQKDVRSPAPDLRHVLSEWRDSGIQTFIKTTRRIGPPLRVEVRRPGWLARRIAWIRRKTLHPNADGAFGQLLEHPPGGG